MENHKFIFNVFNLGKSKHLSGCFFIPIYFVSSQLKFFHKNRF